MAQLKILSCQRATLAFIIAVLSIAARTQAEEAKGPTEASADAGVKEVGAEEVGKPRANPEDAGIVSKIDESAVVDTRQSNATKSITAQPDENKVSVDAERHQRAIVAATSNSGGEASAAVASIPGTSQVTAKVPVPADATVSQGERIEIEGKGFSIEAPRNWIIQRNLARSSLYLQSQDIDSGYSRNISVVRYKGPKVITDTSADEFANKLVSSFPAVSSTIQNYQLRNRQSIQMTDGRDGALFYTDFEGSGRKMMQAHILVSSETYHYLVTYTDVAEHFENSPGATQYLSEAWNAMTSIQLDSPSPVPAEGVANYAIVALIMVGVSSAIYFTRRHLAAKKYREYGNLEPGEVPESVSGFKSTVSEFGLTGVVASEDSESDMASLDDDARDGLDSQSRKFHHAKPIAESSASSDSRRHSSREESARIVEFKSKKQAPAPASSHAETSEKDEMEFTEDVIIVEKAGAFKKGA